VPDRSAPVPTAAAAAPALILAAVLAALRRSLARRGWLPGPVHALVRRWALVRATGEAGMSTAEYAVGTVAACAFAAVLYKVVTGGSIVTALGRLIASALATLS
jgi:mannose/fructose/N-acetylgalactosamine-specific phosphotransferase system component IID